MWSMPLCSPVVISIDLGFSRNVCGVKIYNYNASINESFRGVKHLQLYVDSGEAGQIFVIHSICEVHSGLQVLVLPAAKRLGVLGLTMGICWTCLPRLRRRTREYYISFFVSKGDGSRFFCA